MFGCIVYGPGTCLTSDYCQYCFLYFICFYLFRCVFETRINIHVIYIAGKLESFSCRVTS